MSQVIYSADHIGYARDSVCFSIFQDGSGQDNLLGSEGSTTTKTTTNEDKTSTPAYNTNSIPCDDAVIKPPCGNHEDDGVTLGQRDNSKSNELSQGSVENNINITRRRDKPYSCNLCNKKFSQKHALTRHIHTHTGEKPYACSHCDYTCARKAYLTDHVRTHTGDKPYSCPNCDYTCSTKANLIHHQRTHTGDRPHSCNLCDKEFSRKQDLTRHTLTHTGEKPYSCSYCDYTSARKSSLTKHTLTTHTGK